MVQFLPFEVWEEDGKGRSEGGKKGSSSVYVGVEVGVWRWGDISAWQHQAPHQSPVDGLSML